MTVFYESNLLFCKFTLVSYVCYCWEFPFQYNFCCIEEDVLSVDVSTCVWLIQVDWSKFSQLAAVKCTYRGRLKILQRTLTLIW